MLHRCSRPVGLIDEASAFFITFVNLFITSVNLFITFVNFFHNLCQPFYNLCQPFYKICQPFLKHMPTLSKRAMVGSRALSATDVKQVLQNCYFLLDPGSIVVISCQSLSHCFVVNFVKVDMTQLLLLGKFEYTGGPIFKVVLEC